MTSLRTSAWEAKKTPASEIDCYIITLLYDHDSRYCFRLSLQKLYVFMVTQIKLETFNNVSN